MKVVKLRGADQKSHLAMPAFYDSLREGHTSPSLYRKASTMPAVGFTDAGLGKVKWYPREENKWFSKHVHAIRNEEGCCTIWEYVKMSNYQDPPQS